MDSCLSDLLARNGTQTALSEIWTWVADSIFRYDDRYANHTSRENNYASPRWCWCPLKSRLGNGFFFESTLIKTYASSVYPIFSKFIMTFKRCFPDFSGRHLWWNEALYTFFIFSSDLRNLLSLILSDQYLSIIFFF